MSFKDFYMIEKLNYTKEMEDWFNERTNNHINLVKKYAKLIEEYDPKTFKGLAEVAELHDDSKLNDDIEKIPYIFISWDYHCKDLKKDFKIPEDIKEKMQEATLHHVKNNKHHPEFWAGETANINREDRDKPPKEMVDATEMPDLYIGEMLADWLSMSEEKGTSVKDWANKNVNIRWKFTDHQKDLIYDIINNVKDNK